MLHRFRSAFFHENLLLIVLGLLSESELSEWEILSSLFAKYESTPNDKEFRRLVESIVNGGYASFEGKVGNRKLRLNKRGITLLRRLKEEYRSVVSKTVRYQGINAERARR
jgi:hypothetical protein